MRTAGNTTNAGRSAGGAQRYGCADDLRRQRFSSDALGHAPRHAGPTPGISPAWLQPPLMPPLPARIPIPIRSTATMKAKTPIRNSAIRQTSGIAMCAPTLFPTSKTYGVSRNSPLTDRALIVYTMGHRNAVKVRLSRCLTGQRKAWHSGSCHLLPVRECLMLRDNNRLRVGVVRAGIRAHASSRGRVWRRPVRKVNIARISLDFGDQCSMLSSTFDSLYLQGLL